MANFGESFSRSFDSGYALGNKMMDRKAASDYAKQSKAIDVEEEEDVADQEAIRQAKLDELNNPNGKYASWTPEQKKEAIAEMDTLKERGISEARRAGDIARAQSKVDYYGSIGDVAKADEAKQLMKRQQWSQDFWDKLKGNSGAYDGDIVKALNGDFQAQVMGIQYVHDPKNNTILMTQNGKPMGQAMPITDQMRSPYIQSLYARQFNQQFNTAPTAEDLGAFDKARSALSTGLMNKAKINAYNASADYYKKKGDAALTAANKTAPSNNLFQTSNDTTDDGGRILYRVGKNGSKTEHATMYNLNGVGGSKLECIVPRNWTKSETQDVVKYAESKGMTLMSSQDKGNSYWDAGNNQGFSWEDLRRNMKSGATTSKEDKGTALDSRISRYRKMGSALVNNRIEEQWRNVLKDCETINDVPPEYRSVALRHPDWLGGNKKALNIGPYDENLVTP